MSWIRKVSFVTLATFFSMFFLLLLAELYGIYTSQSVYQMDELYGWKLKEGVSVNLVQKSLDGSAYNVSFKTDSNGMRTFGSQSAKIKILVLGDSFTADPFASNEKMWYSKAVENMALELKRPQSDFFVAATGGGGWGNYQNLLLADEIKKKKFVPDLFIFQFCGNDFENNVYEWERTGIARSQFMRRPYAKIYEGKLVTFYADHPFAPLYRSVFGQSKVFNQLDGILQGLQFKHYGGYGPQLQEDVLALYELRSLSLTSLILSELREKFNGIPSVMVNCTESGKGPNAKWAEVAESVGFMPLTKPSVFLSSTDRKENASMFHMDGGHWSEIGNQRYGEIVAKEVVSLIRAGILSFKE